MEHADYLLKRIAILMNLGIFYTEQGEVHALCEHAEDNPLFGCESLRERLSAGADMQKEPYIYKDRYMVYFACMKKKDVYYFLGPMGLEALERVDLYHYHREYGLKQMEGEQKRFRRFTFSEMLDVVEMASVILNGREYSDNDLIYANELVWQNKEQEEKEQVLFTMKEGEEELYHHTYKEEQKLLDSIREGRTKDALRFSRNMDAELGTLSKKEFNHWKNVAIVAITLCTRAAIDGGISPSIAYRISDFYIQKSDSAADIAQIIKFRDHAIEELTEQVKKKMGRKSSNYVEQCKDYVNKHYREKIYLSDIADTLLLSETYLSKLFKKEAGIRLQDYITEVRLAHAANLLKYSEESLSYIAEYVNFPTQSYFGKVFKEKYGLSPKKYREQKRPAEYFEKRQ